MLSVVLKDFLFYDFRVIDSLPLWCGVVGRDWNFEMGDASWLPRFGDAANHSITLSEFFSPFQVKD